MDFPWHRRTPAEYAREREKMVREQIERRSVADPTVLAAMRSVPRHLFVPEDCVADAYADGPLPIGFGQTISQPYVVASMTEALRLEHTSRVLEVGTGCGYQTAVLAAIACQIYSVEIVPELSEQATALLTRLGLTNIVAAVRNGYAGWPQMAPFDAIIVTAAAPHIPPPLLAQLKLGGRMILPLQENPDGHQDLVLLEKETDSIRRHTLYQVRFVPMVGCGTPPDRPNR